MRHQADIKSSIVQHSPCEFTPFLLPYTQLDKGALHGCVLVCFACLDSLIVLMIVFIVLHSLVLHAV